MRWCHIFLQGTAELPLFISNSWVKFYFNNLFEEMGSVDKFYFEILPMTLLRKILWHDHTCENEELKRNINIVWRSLKSVGIRCKVSWWWTFNMLQHATENAQHVKLHPHAHDSNTNQTSSTGYGHNRGKDHILTVMVVTLRQHINAANSAFFLLTLMCLSKYIGLHCIIISYNVSYLISCLIYKTLTLTS